MSSHHKYLLSLFSVTITTLITLNINASDASTIGASSLTQEIAELRTEIANLETQHSNIMAFIIARREVSRGDWRGTAGYVPVPEAESLLHKIASQRLKLNRLEEQQQLAKWADEFKDSDFDHFTPPAGTRWYRRSPVLSADGCGGIFDTVDKDPDFEAEERHLFKFADMITIGEICLSSLDKVDYSKMTPLDNMLYTRHMRRLKIAEAARIADKAARSTNTSDSR